MTRRIRIATIVGLAVSGTGALLLLWSRSSEHGDGATEHTAAERVALLDNSLRALADAERDMPRDRWDPSWVVSQVGRDADSLREWVAQQTSWIPYRGSLRGPVGVLMDRRGNSLDRALLLSDLAERAGHQVRLARTEFTRSQAEALLPKVLAAGLTAAFVPPPDAPDPVTQEIAAHYDTDSVSVTRTLAPQLDATERLVTQLEERTTRQASILLDAVAGPDGAVEWMTRLDTAVAALREHWWVQVKEGETWRDLELLPPDSSMAPSGPPLETTAPSAVLTSRAHEVVLRVVVERLAQGALHESRVLEYSLRPADLADRLVTLQFWPAAWPSTGHSTTDGGASLRRTALQQQQWRASLVVDDREAAGAVISAATDVAGSASSNPFGAIGNAINSTRRSESGAGSDDLTAVWLDYELRVPGRNARTVRRQVFDLMGPGARETGTISAMNDSLRLVRSLGLMMRTEILVLGANLAPEFVVHQFARNALANKALLRAVAAPGFGADRDRLDSLLGTSRGDVSPLHTLAVLRNDALGDVGFIDRPVVLTRHRHAAFHEGHIMTADAFDIVANDVGVSIAEADGFGARLTQGVWDTNLEALLGARVGNAAEAFEGDGDWSVLASAAQVGADRLSADSRVRLTRELERGAIVVAPDATASHNATDAWWRIDPATGDALGIGPSGWGQGVTLTSPGVFASMMGAPVTSQDWGHFAVILDGAKLLVYAYAECQAIPQAANALNILGEEFWELGLTPSWVTRVPNSNLPELSPSNPRAFGQDVRDFFKGKGAGSASDVRPQFTGKDFEDVAVENNRKCLLSAIRSGFVATAPILLMVMRAEATGARYARMAAQVRRERLLGRRSGQVAARGRAVGGRRGPRVANPNRGQSGLRKTQDLGTTQPNVKTTLPIAGTPTMTGIGKSGPQPKGPMPKSLAEARKGYQEALDASVAASTNHLNSTRTLVQYRAAVRDGLRPFDPDYHDKLVGENQDTEALADIAAGRFRQSEANLKWAKKAAIRNEIPGDDLGSGPALPGGSGPGAPAGGDPQPNSQRPTREAPAPAAPRPVTSLSNALMAVGLAGLTGSK